MVSDTRILTRKVLARGFGMLEDIVFRHRRFDGRLQEVEREVYHRDDAVTILLYDSARRTVVLVRQFRPAAFVNDASETVIETPAGKLEGEEPAIRIAKEVEEETGFRIAAPRRIFASFMSPACLTEKITFFVAPYVASDRVGRGGGLASEGEDIEVLEPTLEEALAMVERGEIVDIKTIALLYYASGTKLMDA